MLDDLSSPAPPPPPDAEEDERAVRGDGAVAVLLAVVLGAELMFCRGTAARTRGLFLLDGGGVEGDWAGDGVVRVGRMGGRGGEPGGRVVLQAGVMRACVYVCVCV